MTKTTNKCQGTNKSGCGCKRNATYAGYCWQHAKSSNMPTINPPVSITLPTCRCCHERDTMSPDERYCSSCLRNILDSRDQQDELIENATDEQRQDITASVETLLYGESITYPTIEVIERIETSSPTHTNQQPVIVANLDSLNGLARYHALRNACKVAGLSVKRGMKATDLYDMLAKYNAPLLNNAESKATVTTESTTSKSQKPGPKGKKGRCAKKVSEVITPVVSAHVATQQTTLVDPIALHTVAGLTLAEMRETSVARIVESLNGIKTFDKANGQCRMRVVNTVRKAMLNGASLTEAVDAFTHYTSAAEFVIDCE